MENTPEAVEEKTTGGPDDLLSVAEAADVAGCAPVVMRRAIDAGRVPYYEVHRGKIQVLTKVRRADAEAYTHKAPHNEAKRLRYLARRGEA